MKTVIAGKSQSITPVFARHETFHPRYGWLKKGFDKAVEYPDVFLRDDAPTILGVGKNMVRAIKYWCLAFKVLEEATSKDGTKGLLPSPFGMKLLSDDGWDPYLEHAASLWLLHWNLLKSPSLATAWHYLFNIFNKNNFSEEEVRNGLILFKDQSFPNRRIEESSINKDISCLLRMYCEQNDRKSMSEDSIDSPFSELGLLSRYSDDGRLVFNAGAKRSLPNNVLVATCLDYVASIEDSARTISISRLAYDAGSPGLCFRLSESALYDAIEQVAKGCDEITLSDTAGLIQLTFEGNPKRLSDMLIKDYYSRGRN